MGTVENNATSQPQKPTSQESVKGKAKSWVDRDNFVPMIAAIVPLLIALVGLFANNQQNASKIDQLNNTILTLTISAPQTIQGAATPTLTPILSLTVTPASTQTPTPSPTATVNSTATLQAPFFIKTFNFEDEKSEDKVTIWRTAGQVTNISYSKDHSCSGNGSLRLDMNVDVKEGDASSFGIAISSGEIGNITHNRVLAITANVFLPSNDESTNQYFHFSPYFGYDSFVPSPTSTPLADRYWRTKWGSELQPGKCTTITWIDPPIFSKNTGQNLSFLELRIHVWSNNGNFYYNHEIYIDDITFYIDENSSELIPWN